ncbi:MAG: N-acetyltransferase [Bacteroidales bacterium]|nr:N-acetyltransferase [Bacteroidales bacterium]
MRANLLVKKVESSKLLRQFIFLPEKIHADHKQWVHPLYFDDKVFFDEKKNKSFLTADTILLLAYQDNKAVGRIMGIINNRYNEVHHEKNARFCFLDCYEDIEIAKVLIEEVEHWARNKGMEKLVGPLGFSDKDPQGMLIEGFDEKVVIATNYNYPWMPSYIEQLGFMKEVDLVSYLIKIPEVIPPFLDRIYQRAARNPDIIIREFSKKKELKPWVVPIFQLINEAYKHIYGFIPLEETEIISYAKRYLPILDPHFVKVITDKNDKVIAFIISMPELSDGIRKAKGRIFPFGWYHILTAGKKARLLTLLLGAVDPKWRGKGLDVILGVSILKTAIKNDMENMDSHLILENNSIMRAEYIRYEGRLHKRYRIFSKPIS